MRALLQRVTEASVFLKETEEPISAIGPGLLVFVCAMEGDQESEVDWLAKKIAKLRIFEDEAGMMNLSITDIRGAILVVSQFTLAAETKRGNRPGFSAGADLEIAKLICENFVRSLRKLGLSVQTGRFQANMQIASVNDGPVTIWMDTVTRHTG